MNESTVQEYRSLAQGLHKACGEAKANGMLDLPMNHRSGEENKTQTYCTHV